MKTSQEINHLAGALAKAQAAISKAEKNSENPHFRSSYADLGAIWDACREPLTLNGLSITQWVSSQEGERGLITMLMHSSGQFISSFFPFIIEKPTMQGLGSAISYAKRYSLMAAIGIAEADDDGNEASQFPKKSNTPFPKPTPIVQPVKSIGLTIYERLKSELNLSDDLCKEFLTSNIGKDSFKKVTKDDLPILTNRIEELKKELDNNANETDFENFK